MSDIRLETIMQACPEFRSWAANIGGFLRDWGELFRIAGQLGPMIGLSTAAWDQALNELGKQTAVTAFVLLFENHCAGEMTSPNGYLRGMTKKARAGQLHLSRSIYGRLNRPASNLNHLFAACRLRLQREKRYLCLR